MSCLLSGLRENPVALLAAILTFIGALLTVFVSPWLKEQFDIRAQYLVPYAKWCAEFYGIVSEFKELCRNLEYDRPMSRNHSQVIYHVYEMHRAVEEGYRWLGKIEKDNYFSSEHFDDLFDGVDRIWHLLEKKHRRLIGKQTNPDDFRLILRHLNKYEESHIVYLIKGVLEQRVYFKDDIPIIEEFLYRRIPGHAYWEGFKRILKRQFTNPHVKVIVNKKGTFLVDAGVTWKTATVTKAITKVTVKNKSKEFVEIFGVELQFKMYDREYFIRSAETVKRILLSPKGELESEWKGTLTFEFDYQLPNTQKIHDAELYVYHSFGRDTKEKIALAR